MASLGDLTLFISAETKRAQQDIQGLGKEADKVSNQKREIDFSLDKARNNIKNFKRDLETVGKTAQAAFKVAKMEGVFDDEIESAEILVKKTKQVGSALNEARKPGQVLQKTFDGIAGSAVGVVNSLAKVGFALYGIQQITGVLKQAFGGLFNATVGESIRLQESILKTQTALASTNDILRNGEVITDPYEAIVALTGTIEQRIASIRDRSLELAGVTSNEVIEVFGMVAQQIGSIGGSLKDAEDLAISFAGALGTFGIPLYQARQEIGSILRGDITTDSYLAKSLGITNEDVAKAKQSTEGVVGFLEKRLQTAVAGQRIAAQSFAGVASNIADFQELFGQAFGDGLVQPLIDGLTKVYNLLVLIKDNALTAATSLGQAFGGAARILGGAAGAGAAQTTGGSAAAVQASNTAQAAAQRASRALTKLALDIRTTLQGIVTDITSIIGKVGRGLAKLGTAFVSLNIKVFQNLLETFQFLISAVNGFASAFEGVLTLYAGFLSLPVVQTLAEVGAQFKLLETLGVGSLVKVVLTGGVLVASLGKLKAMIASVVAFFQGALSAALSAAGTALQAFAVAIDLLLKKLGITNVQLTQFIAQLNATGASASAAGAKLGVATGAATMFGKGLMALTIKLLAFNALLVGIQLAIAAVVQAVANFNEEAKKARAFDEFNESMTQLNTTFKDVNENSTAAQQALKRVAEAEANNKIKELQDNFTEAATAASELEEEVIALREANKSVGPGAFGGAAASLRSAEQQLADLIDKRDKAERQLNEATAKHEAYLSETNLAEDIQNRSKQHGKLNEDLAKARESLNRSIRQREFAAQQELAQRRIQLFQAEEDLRIKQLEARNRKLIEGEEGASAAALAAFNDYISQRERGELDLEAQKRELAIANANVEEQISNYKYDIEQKILDLKKKGLKISQVEAELAGKKKEAAEANISLTGIESETTTTPTAADLGIVSAGGFADAKRAAQGIAQQILNQQSSAQGFVNQQNLDKIVEQLLPNRQLEPFKNSLEQSSALLEQLGKNIPLEATKINAELSAINAINQREVTETLEHLRKELVDQPEIYNYLRDAIDKAYNGEGGILQQLKNEALLRSAANEKQREANAIMGLRQSAQRGTTQTDQNLIMGSAQMAAGSEFDLFNRNRILAQGRIDSRRAELEQDGPMSESVAAEFEKFSQTELFNAERQAEMEGMLQRFQQLGEIASGVGNAISTAFTQGFADILSGAASVQDVLSNMFKSIADSFMQMAQKIIADMIKMLILKTMLKIFVGSTGGGGGAQAATDGLNIDGIQGYIDSSSVLTPFARGGIVNGPTAAMIGEGGMNEAVVPLPNGKAIPVDFGRNGKMGGDVTSNVTVNVDQSGSDTQMNGESANKLGVAINSAVKRVIMEERRAGGLLYNGRR